MKRDIAFIIIFCIVASIVCNLVGLFLSNFIHLI
nr:MAG TPA: ATPase [Caudoviricetes sp.]